MEILFLIGIICFLLFRFFRPKGAVGEWAVSGKIERLIKTNSDYHLFNNVILKALGGTTQIDHILISPYGVFVIETKNYKGWIFGGENQRRWTQSLRRKYTAYSLFNKYKFQFQNPLHQNYKHIKAVESFLGVASKLVFNVVVFVGDSEFKTDMPNNVMKLRDFLPYIKSHTERIINEETVEKFCLKFRAHMSSASFNEDDHMRSIEQNVVSPVCPRCGKAMVLRVARKGPGAGSEFWGCSNYPSCKAIKPVLM